MYLSCRRFLCLFHSAAENFRQLVKYIACLFCISRTIPGLFILRPHMGKPPGKLPHFFLITRFLVINKAQFYICITVIRSNLRRQQFRNFNRTCLPRSPYYTDQLMRRKIQDDWNIIQHIVVFFNKIWFVSQLILINRKSFLLCLDRNRKRHISHTKPVCQIIFVRRVAVPQNPPASVI